MNKTVELWKQIEGFNGCYEVSNTGKVRSLNYRRTGKTKELEISVDRYGYPCISLPAPNNKRKHFTIHRLVAVAFVQNPDNKAEVNHKDGDKRNNHFSNLEWVTMQENQKHAWENGLKENSRAVSSERGKSPKTIARLSGYNARRKRLIISKCIATGEEKMYSTQREAARAINGDQGNIQKVLKGKVKQHKGYTFRYATLEPENGRDNENENEE